MRRETENVVLLIVGVAVAMVTVTGAYTRYVKPAMLPWLAVSAVLLIGLALTVIARDIRGGGEHEHSGHAHRSGIVWLLVIPVVLLIFIVPPALSAKATPPATVTVTEAQSFPPLPPGPSPMLSLPEVLMRIAVGPVGGVDGKRITTTGFTMRDGDRVYLAKIVIFCCAADAQLSRLQLTGPASPVAAALPENTWARVEGVVPPGQRYSGTDSVPMLEVSSVVRIDPPANTYGS